MKGVRGMEKAPKAKRTLLEIENVRVIENDDRNVVVERLEESINPTIKEVTHSWKFKGYCGSILSALWLIVDKELLINRNAVNDLEGYLRSVEESNASVLMAIKNARRQPDA